LQAANTKVETTEDGEKLGRKESSPVNFLPEVVDKRGDTKTIETAKRRGGKLKIHQKEGDPYSKGGGDNFEETKLQKEFEALGDKGER